MSEVLPENTPSASEIRNRIAREKVAGATPSAKINYRKTDAYKKAYAEAMRAAGKAAAHARYKREGVAAKIAKADAAKKLAAKTAS